MTLACFATTFTRDSTPGPGAYSTETHNAVGNRYSIHCAVRPKYPAREPYRSKADYAPLSTTLSGRQSTIGLKFKEPEDKFRVPGPEYAPNPREFFSKSVCIKQRYKDPDSSMFPGPGTYTPQEPGASSNTKTPPMCARSKIVLADMPDSPGPAAYEPVREFGKTSPSYTIRPKTADPRDRNPNPGFAYNNQRVTGRDTPRWSIPRAKTRAEVNEVPGPGAYEQVPAGGNTRLSPSIRPMYPAEHKFVADPPLENLREFPDVRKATIGVKTGKGFWDFDKEVPGPSYLPGTTNEGRKITIGLKRPPKDIMETPGPADYNPRNPSSPDPPVFTCKGPGERDSWLPRKNDEPGPGQFNLRSGNDMPKWIIGERSVTRSEKSRCSTREALVHGRKSKFNRAKTSMGRRRRDVLED